MSGVTVVSDSGEDEGSTGAVVDVAFVAGEAVAHVEQLSEDVAEATATAETAIAVADQAASVSVEAVTMADVLRSQNVAILENTEQIKSGMLILSEAITEFLEELRKEPEPEPEPPKRDTAPKRKSGAHKFLYG